MNWLQKIFHPVKVVVNPIYKEYADFVGQLPDLFGLTPAEASSRGGYRICKARNELRLFEVGDKAFVVKAFQVPNIINKVVYGAFRASKAQRSYEYAMSLNENQIPSPVPVAYLTRRRFLLFADSYYVCLKSKCRFEYRDWVLGKTSNRIDEMLRGVGRMVARMHDSGMVHKDLSMGNILYDFFAPDSDEPSDAGSELRMEIIDLNRLRFHKIGLEEGCNNFDRLVATPEDAVIVADEYIRARHIPAEMADKAREMIVAAMGRAHL